MALSNANGTPPDAKRIAPLDGLRGVAILLVLMVHLVLFGVVPGTPKFMWVLQRVMWSGWSGVDLFFVLSGFLITGILLDSRTSAGYFKNFYMRRVLRIFPLYYLVIFAALLVTPIVSAHLPWVRTLYPTPAGWLSYFLFYQNWWLPMKESSRTLLGAFWSLGVEEQFYLVWPACVWFVAPRGLKWLCGAGAIFALALRFVMARSGAGAEIILMSTATRMDSLLIGAFLAVAIRDRGLLPTVSKLTPYVFASSVVGFLCIDLFGRETRSRGYYTETIGFTFLACAYGCAVLWAFLQNGTRTWLDRIMNIRLLRMFGKYSYGIYVFHGVIFLMLSRMLRGYSWYGKSIALSALACIGFVAVTFAIAALSFRFIESPFLSMKKYFKSQKQDARVA